MTHTAKIQFIVTYFVRTSLTLVRIEP